MKILRTVCVWAAGLLVLAAAAVLAIFSYHAVVFGIQMAWIVLFGYNSMAVVYFAVFSGVASAVSCIGSGVPLAIASMRLTESLFPTRETVVLRPRRIHDLGNARLVS